MFVAGCVLLFVVRWLLFPVRCRRWSLFFVGWMVVVVRCGWALLCVVC